MFSDFDASIDVAVVEKLYAPMVLITLINIDINYIYDLQLRLSTYSV